MNLQRFQASNVKFKIRNVYIYYIRKFTGKIYSLFSPTLLHVWFGAAKIDILDWQRYHTKNHSILKNTCELYVTY